jgi:signal transduction histidine kinase
MLIILVENYYEDEMKAEMYREANIIALNLKATDYFGEGNEEYLPIINALVEGRAIIVNSNGIVTYDTNGLEEGKFYATQEVIDGLKGESSYYLLEEQKIGKVIIPINDKYYGDPLGVVIVSNSYDSIYEASNYIGGISLLLILALSLVVILLSYYSSYVLIKPFNRFIEYMNDILNGHTTKQIVIDDNYEIAQISHSFNHMIERISKIEENRQQFVADVSHELKTPLSAMKVLSESILSLEEVDVAVYREFLEDISSEIDRETKIINDLLILVTLDKKDNELTISKVNINELIESTMKLLKPLADEKNIQLVFESYRSVIAEVDKSKITLVIINLIENAIKYNKEFGYINVCLNADHKEFKVFVKDTGLGIPKESTEKIFRRFYRVDKTRDRGTGGTGLGLSIVYQAILMHNGTIKCESEVNKGTTFTFTIPLKYIS